MPQHFYFAQGLSEVINAICGTSNELRQKRIQAIAECRKQEKIYDLETRNQLKALEIEFAGQLQRIQEREARTTQDYREFLDTIDEMKIQIVESFPDMPKVMALVIHQHAKHLVDKMWNDSNEQHQALFQAELAAFLGLVFDDTSRVMVDNKSTKIPDKTLAHIENHAQAIKTEDYLNTHFPGKH